MLFTHLHYIAAVHSTIIENDIDFEFICSLCAKFSQYIIYHKSSKTSNTQKNLINMCIINNSSAFSHIN